ncbi:bifunctional phosphopantothenoylcysteine decarboxylase/phosphopantothenate--cysteine ligase CoaBC [Clostridium sp. BNL1100]|uniref:bifunctional phosphopantothenoylcysteine decarboxylase/phosphopantothenate--cysteine ligase CoaBC n=1 Tax=Clostridium sp. BNL1100 TaxID=755731 RepID=UPI00024A7B06|nr:bifunctional phosphopantothenoylcysteine decarboxylase/phosphopantothenate--cysteine ligase CoaBC [Clostridium sp. BNL1100]AEY67955.1 phosphopantothenoylcysteine decarboxylase/phosphopantothenate--cysteine ligase [Clostridium sp. BNL1100]
MKNIILGVTGSIAAYKAADIANILTKRGYNVDVIMTKSAMEFITPLTFQSLTKNKVYWNMFEEITPKEIKHISLAKKADLCLLAPASANLIGKIASGIADDMLTTVVMAMNKIPVYICPAMNTNMYNNPIVQRNIRTLSELGYRFIDPKEAVLACGDLGKGALADVETIVNTVETYFK